MAASYIWTKVLKIDLKVVFFILFLLEMAQTILVVFWHTLFKCYIYVVITIYPKIFSAN